MPKGLPRDKSTQRRIIHRLKIVKGHLEKVIEMTENGEYCIDIVHQSIAIQASLKAVDQLILKNHMETCLADSIRKGNGKEVIDEITKILEKK